MTSQIQENHGKSRFNPFGLNKVAEVMSSLFAVFPRLGQVPWSRRYDRPVLLAGEVNTEYCPLNTLNINILYIATWHNLIGLKSKVST